MKLVTRFTLVLTGGMTAVAIAGGAGLALMHDAVQTYRLQVQSMNANARAIATIRSGFQTQVQEWKNVLLRGRDAAQRDKYWSGFQHQEAEIAAAAQRLRDALPAGPARELVAAFAAAHQQMGRRYREGLRAFTDAGFEAAAGDAAVKGIDRDANETLHRAIEAISADAAAAASAADRSADRALVASIAAMALVTAVAGAALVVHLRRCLRRLDVTVSAVGRVARGDLSEPVIAPPGRDELSQLAGTAADMQRALADVVATVRRNADGVANASGEIAQGNLDLSTRTERQAAALQESAAAMSQLDATVRQTAEQASTAHRVARDAADQARQGGEAMAGVVSTMSDINATAQRIGEIVGVIDGIAFQTNLLALNAAVEAARAGDLGRGFAVVAGEVRALAGRSATAAREIRDLVGRSTAELGTGNDRVANAGRAMNDIVAAIGGLGTLVGEISAACSQQSDGVRQVGAAVAEIDQATQKNAALVEQSAAATASLKQQAQQMVSSVAVFRIPAAA